MANLSFCEHFQCNVNHLHFSMFRVYWIGIAAMSVLIPFRKDVEYRTKHRVLGNILGSAIFFISYLILPEEIRPCLGIIGESEPDSLPAMYGNLHLMHSAQLQWLYQLLVLLMQFYFVFLQMYLAQFICGCLIGYLTHFFFYQSDI